MKTTKLFMLGNLDLPKNAPGRILCPKCKAMFKAKFAVKNQEGQPVCPGCKNIVKAEAVDHAK